jgi:hypothetical protein
MPYSATDMHSGTHLRINDPGLGDYAFAYGQPNEPEGKAIYRSQLMKTLNEALAKQISPSLCPLVLYWRDEGAPSTRHFVGPSQASWTLAKQCIQGVLAQAC